MLKLINVTKDYVVGDQVTHALRGINLAFRKSEFVAILGQSGCGKTTLMNIIGGLDRMTSGEILINGESTSNYTEKDWDDYRNRKIGFVFQNYNLIPHISVLDNVELSLTISGISKEERTRRAKEALISVGLESEIHKRPNQLSGGQMQRVAIARAIVNEPEILLADEPTGAVDSETSIQLMDILQKIATDRLVIMVTHNAELALQYSNRIVKALDGLIIEDSNPYDDAEEIHEPILDKKAKRKSRKLSTMSFWTSIKLAWKNIINKRGRSILTAIAGSIGIIAISLILSLNNGFSQYITEFEEQSMAKYPVTITSGNDSVMSMFKDFLGGDALSGDSLDYSAVLDLFADQETDRTKYTTEQIVYIYAQFSEMFEKMMNSIQKTNDISKFKKYLEENFDYSLGTVKYDYSIGMTIYKKTETEVEVGEGEDPQPPTVSYTQLAPLSESDTLKAVTTILGEETTEDEYDGVTSLLDAFNFWDEIVGDDKIVNQQYDVLAGHLPTNMNEVVLVLDEYNQITDFDLLLLDEIGMMDLIAAMGDKTYFDEYEKTFSQALGTEFYVLPTSKAFVYNETTQVYNDLRKNKNDTRFLNAMKNDSIKLTIAGVIRPKPGTKGCINGILGYSSDLSSYIINDANNSAYVKAQIKSYDDWMAAIEAAKGIELTKEDGTPKEQSDFTTEEKQILAKAALGIIDVTTKFTSIDNSKYKTILSRANYRDLEQPSYIYIYPSSVKNKEKVSAFVEAYNTKQASEEKYAEEQAEENGEDAPTTTYVVAYQDDLDSAVTELTDLSNTITYILIAVALVSVIVTMILIAIVMYISVQDRTREIGIMRSLGARKLDISNIFNVETMILGLVSGLLGVLLGFVLIYPANLILKATMGVGSMMRMAIWHPFVLVAGAVFITVLSGLVPSVIAAKKDPVIALRTE
ncbi:MAG: ABC transporter ATP-binding protein/permease [Clostridia bacterium]|nr:ABC transporter ATP-binding protein/permease [Clostridia bacterium]